MTAPLPAGGDAHAFTEVVAPLGADLRWRFRIARLRATHWIGSVLVPRVLLPGVLAAGGMLLLSLLWARLLHDWYAGLVSLRPVP